MINNLEKLGGLVHSQQVLLALTQKVQVEKTPMKWFKVMQ